MGRAGTWTEILSTSENALSHMEGCSRFLVFSPISDFETLEIAVRLALSLAVGTILCYRCRQNRAHRLAVVNHPAATLVI